MNFKLIHFLFGIKVPHKSPNFESQLSIALVKVCQIPYLIFQTQVSFSSHFASLSSAMKDNSSVRLHFFHSRNHSKWKFLRFLSARIKIHRIFVSFETTNQVFFQILHQSSVSWETSPLYFFSWNCIRFQQKEPIKVQIWWNWKSEIWHSDWATFVKII